jgi:drug/metabolite transporter (DMT)-like permease
LSDRARGLAALALAALFWSTTYVVAKTVLEVFPPLTLALARFTIASAIFLPLGLHRPGRSPARRDVVLLGLLGVTGFYACFNIGLALTSAADAALIQGAGPALTALVALGWLGERLPRLSWVGVVLSALGVASIVLGSTPRADAPAPLLGNLLTLGSAACWAGYTVQCKRLASFSPTRLTALGVAVGTILLVPLAGVELALVGFGASTVGGWLGLLYLALGPSAAAYLLWAYGVRGVPANQAGAFLNLVPVVAVVLALLVLGEQPGPSALLGGALVLLGVWLTTRPVSGGLSRRT